MSESSAQLFERALKVIPGGVNSPVRAFRAVGGSPFFAQSAQGAYLHDVDGHSYVDYVCTWGPAILGHAPESVRVALRQALEEGTSFGVPGPREVEMAEIITRWVPSVKKVRLCNSGTEATMSCIRLARGFTGREMIIKFEGCYHGHVDSLLVKAGSGALTLGLPDSAGIPRSLAAQTISLPFNNRARLKTAFQEHGDQLAAVIVEPIPANAGLIPPHAEFLEHLRELCTHYGALLIFDEVMTGFRLAKGGAQEILGITPDLSAFGKVIGGGLPVGAFGGREDIMDFLAPLGPVYQAGTLSGNPLAMAAGLAQLHELEARNAFQVLEQMGSALESGLREVLVQWGKPFQLVRRGSMFCLFFTAEEVTNLDTAKTSDTALFAKFFHNMLQNGVYFPPSQYETCFLSLAHGPEEIDKTIRAVRSSLP
jgi:glutamate-1-semialdehyde 2,1-aminomutase